MNRINCRAVPRILMFLAALIVASIANAQSAPKAEATGNQLAATNVNVVNTPTVKVVGTRPTGYVVLSNGGTLGCTSWFRIARDGTPTSFTIPTGQNLMITDMEFYAFNTVSIPGAYEALELTLPPFGEVVLGSFALVDSTGAVATQQHLTTGIVMSVLPTCFTGTSSNTGEQVVIRGYLIPAN